MNPVSLDSDKHRISPYDIIQVTRIKEMIAKDSSNVLMFKQILPTSTHKRDLQNSKENMNGNIGAESVNSLTSKELQCPSELALYCLSRVV